jgi:hypothetical protein
MCHTSTGNRALHQDIRIAGSLRTLCAAGARFATISRRQISCLRADESDRHCLSASRGQAKLTGRFFEDFKSRHVPDVTHKPCHFQLFIG